MGRPMEAIVQIIKINTISSQKSRQIVQCGGLGSKGREHTAKQEGKVRDCSKLTTLFVMELKKNGPRHRQTKGPNKKTTVESFFFRGKWGGNITAPWWTI